MKNNKPNQKEMKELENLFNLNKLDELEKKLINLIGEYPKISIFYNILGVVLQKKNNSDDAIKNFNKAINLQPNFDQAHNNLGNALKSINKFEESINSYKQAIKINPKYAEAYNNLGNTLAELGKFEESVEKQREAINLDSTYPDFYMNLGSSLAELGKFDEAIINYEKAIKINPIYAEAYSNLGNILAEKGKFSEAIYNQKKALELNPKFVKAIFCESMIRLSLCEFEIGWKKYEYRPDKPLRYKPDKAWDGKYVDGTLLVWGEQGIGDQILFSSMIFELKNYAKNIVLEIDSRLEDLFKRHLEKINCSNIKLINFGKKSPDSFDKHIALGSLGQFLRNSKKSFSGTPKKFLIASKSKQNEYRKKFLNNKKFKIGISWKTLNKVQPYRNIQLNDMLPILSTPNCDFINLQFGEFENDLKNFKSRSGIEVRSIKEIDNYHDIDGLAALISSLDLVITITNSTAHLAGALGIKTYVMVSKMGTPKWHWIASDKNSLWYPSLHIFRQKSIGSWNNVIVDIADNLKKLIYNLK
tara:strand:- start:637 stop:2226 length:1590 start_codon:yes stop_codon:yes gene_type:complete